MNLFRRILKNKSTYRYRINYILKPYMFILIGLITGYTFLHWLLVIRLNLFQADREILNFFIPLVICSLLSIYISKSKLKDLDCDKVFDRYDDICFFILLSSLLFPLIVTLNYIESATFRLTELRKIADIGEHPSSKCYTVHHYYIDKDKAVFKKTKEEGGRSNRRFIYTLYVVIPIYNNRLERESEAPKAWFAKEYSNSVSIYADIDEKIKASDNLMSEYESSLRSNKILDFIYLKKLTNEDDKSEFISATKRSPYYKDCPIVMGVNEHFEDRNDNNIGFVIASIVISASVFLIAIMIPPIGYKKSFSE